MSRSANSPHARARSRETAGIERTTTSAAASGRRAQPRGIARREQIIDAAVELFAERGFRGTGIIGLAKEVGLTHAGLLYHFGTKENLLLEVARRRDAYQAQLQEGLASRRGLDALRLLGEVAEDNLSAPVYTRLFAVLIAENLRAEDPLHEYFVIRQHIVREYFAHAVRTGQEDGEIRPDVDPDTVGAEVLAFIVGMNTQWLLDPDAVDVRVCYAQYADRLVADLGTRPPRPPGRGSRAQR